MASLTDANPDIDRVFSSKGEAIASHVFRAFVPTSKGRLADACSVLQRVLLSAPDAIARAIGSFHPPWRVVLVVAGRSVRLLLGIFTRLRSERLARHARTSHQLRPRVMRRRLPGAVSDAEPLRVFG